MCVCVCVRHHFNFSTLWCFRPYKPYIFWKLYVQGYLNWYSQVSHTQIHKYTNTQIHKYTNTNFIGLFKDIKNYISTYKYANNCMSPFCRSFWVLHNCTMSSLSSCSKMHKIKCRDAYHAAAALCKSDWKVHWWVEVKELRKKVHWSLALVSCILRSCTQCCPLPGHKQTGEPTRQVDRHPNW